MTDIQALQDRISEMWYALYEIGREAENVLKMDGTDKDAYAAEMFDALEEIYFKAQKASGMADAPDPDALMADLRKMVRK